MTIRQALHTDIPRMLELGQEMHAESPRFSKLSFDPQRLRFALGFAIDGHFCMVAEHDGQIIGGLAATITPHWFSPDLTACDMALFIAPEYRGGAAVVRLLNAYRKWATEKGSKMTLLGIMTGVDVEKTALSCERLGWRRAGIVLEA